MQTGLRIRRARRTNTNRRGANSQRGISLRNKRCDGVNKRSVVTRASNSCAQRLTAISAECKDLRLCSANIKTDPAHRPSDRFAEVINWKNSDRAAAFERNVPCNLLVVVIAPGCCTPR